MSVSCVCSASHGQPPGERNASMTATASSSRAPGRSQDPTSTSICGGSSSRVSSSASASVRPGSASGELIQTTDPSAAAATTTIAEDQREQALAVARRSAFLASEALQLAQRDIDAYRPQGWGEPGGWGGPVQGGWGGRRGGGAGDLMGGIMGGLVIGSILDGIFD